MKTEEIKFFFDKKAGVREKNFLNDSILFYEQIERQKTVISLLNPKEEDVLLEIGCGTGNDSQIICKNAKYFGGDISYNMILKTKEKFSELKLVIFDAVNLPFKSNSFTKILCSETIEHIPDYTRALREMFRVLSPTGFLILSTPNKSGIYYAVKIFLREIRKILKRAYRAEHPFDEWKNPKQFIKELIQCGFKIQQFDTIIFLPGEFIYYFPVQLKKILISVFEPVEYICRKYKFHFGYINIFKCVKSNNYV